MLNRGVVHIVVADYIVDNYYFRLDREVVNNMNRSSVKHQRAMVNNITSHNNMNHYSVKHKKVMVNNVTATTI
jgi:hypothetical protein